MGGAEHRSEIKDKRRTERQCARWPPDLDPDLVRRDIGRARDRLALLGGGQRVGLHLGVREQAHLQLHGHLPRPGHLAHELRSNQESGRKSSKYARLVGSR